MYTYIHIYISSEEGFVRSNVLYKHQLLYDTSYMYIYIYIYIYTHIHIYIYIHTYLHIYIYIYIHIYIYIYIYIHPHTYIHTHTFTYIYIYIYIYTHTQGETIKLSSIRKQHYSFILRLLLKKSIQVTWLCSRADIYSMYLPLISITALIRIRNWELGGDQAGFGVVGGHVGDVLDVWPSEVVQQVQVRGGGGGLWEKGLKS